MGFRGPARGILLVGDELVEEDVRHGTGRGDLLVLHPEALADLLSEAVLG